MVCEGNRQNLIGLSFYEFLLRLDKAVERNTKQQERNNKAK